MTRSTQLIRYSVLALAASTLMACNDKNDPPVAAPAPAPAPAPGPAPSPMPIAVVPDTFVLTSGNKLVGFAAAAPASTVTVNLAIPAAETLLGGDFRPIDGALYVVTKVTADNSLKVYTANTTTGALGTAIPLVNNGGGVSGVAGTPITLAANRAAVDFNPVANALRIVDATGINLRSTLAAGNNTAIDAPVPTGVAESAYTNSFAATCLTDLYHINATQLLLSAAPNGVPTSPAAGARFVGGLGVVADGNSGFDIRTSATGTRNVLTAALKVSGAYGLYTINDQTGAASKVGDIGGVGTDNILSLAAIQPSTAPANLPGNMFAITAGTSPSLLNFNRPPQGSPAKLCSTTAISGLSTGDAIVGADTRPNGGAVTVLAKNGTAGALYTLSAAGVASARLPLTVAGGGAVSLTGANFGVDFNPVPDRLRVVGDDGQNLRINPADGVTIADTTLSNTQGGAARVGISAAAYTNSLFGGNGASLTTTLFGLDSATNALVRIGSDPANGTAGDPGNPNSGVVTTLSNLTTSTNTPVDISDVNAFEIIATTGTALIAANAGTATVATLYTVDLASGITAVSGNFAAPIVALGTTAAQTATVFGVTPTNKLVSFLPSAPGTVTALGTITVAAGETVRGIDYRPSIGPKNGTLVALATAAGGTTKLYTVNPANAAATLLSTFSANATDTTAPYMSASGSNFGIDFNPLPDALRTVSDTQQNLRSNPDSGATFTDANLNLAGVYGAGYTNSFTTAATTALFYLRDVSGGNSTLQTTTAPNDGVLTVVGTDLGADFSLVGDIDIAGGQNGFALAALQPQAGGVSGLFRINTTAGTATSIGNVVTDGSEPLVGIAIQVR